MFTIVMSISAMKRPIIVTAKIGHLRAYSSSAGGLVRSRVTNAPGYRPPDDRHAVCRPRGRDPALRGLAAHQPLVRARRAARERDSLARRGGLRRGRVERAERGA